MESLHATAALMGAHPAYRAPAELLDGVRRILAGAQITQSRRK
jgi:hypothetical protein